MSADGSSVAGEIRQENGQRRWGGPPEGWEGPAPPKRGAEVFIGKLPRDLTEEELLPILQQVGLVYELRLMIDFTGANRGFCFATFATKEAAKEACLRLNNYEVRQGKHMGVVMSIDNCRLFVGGIPRERQRDEILGEMVKLVDGVADVIVYPSATDKTKNRGFAFVEFDSHKSAAQARRKLGPGRVQLWGQPICVDWAEPEQEVDDQTMATVRVLYVRNLMLSTTEESIRSHFDALHPGTVERVKKLKDFAFVHYTERQVALDNLAKLNGTTLDGAVLEVQLSKPPDKSIMRYVKSAQKNSPGVTGDIVAAATHNFLQHQAQLQPAFSTGPADPLTWAYTGSPFIQAPANAGLLAASPLGGNPFLAGQQQGQEGSRPGTLHRGAAGMRSAGFLAHVNKHVRNARNRRSADTTLLAYENGAYPYPLAATAAALGAAQVQQPNVVWLPAVQAQHLQTLQAMAIQQHLAASFHLPASAGLVKKASEHLEEYCRGAGLGVPEVEVSEFQADYAGNELTLYVAKIILGGLGGVDGLGRSGTPFRTAEEARECAAQLALIQLGAAFLPPTANAAAPAAAATEFPELGPALPHH